MPKYGRLSHTSEFTKVYKNAKKWHCYDASVYFLAADEFRFAVVASKKIGNAVERNRSRRVIKEAFRKVCPRVMPCYDIVLVARSKTKYIKSTRIEDIMTKIFENEGMLKTDGGER